jgi:alanine-glyoxylate transaminase/serine-glyoxylate transaminase/serine-pyruvate transaminase
MSEDVFFQNPGPTNIPFRVMEAMRRPVIDFRGTAFREIVAECIDGVGKVLRTQDPVIIYPATGHGAWEAALVNLFSPGDEILSLSIGYFGNGWAQYAKQFGLKATILQGHPQTGVDYEAFAEALKADGGRAIKGILVTHCETSTGAMTDIKRVREVMDSVGHPALLLVDIISSLGCADFRMDDWGVDIAAGASQKGLMLATGLSFTGISAKALEQSKQAKLPRAYWNWSAMLVDGRQQNFPGTAPVHLFYGLQESLRMIAEEGLDAILQRHRSYAAAVRAAVATWSTAGQVQLYVAPEVASPAVTAVILTQGSGAERLRATALADYKVQLGGGLGDLVDRSFRIAHMGKLHASQLLGVLAGVEMTMAQEGIAFGSGALEAARSTLAAPTEPLRLAS